MNRATAVVSALFFAVALGAVVVNWVRPGTFNGTVSRVIPDFGIFYVAACLASDGANPYDFRLLAEAEREIDPADKPLPAMSPPWSLATLVPLTGVGFETARVAWFFLHLGLLTACGGALWTYFGGDPNRAAFGPLLAVAGYPAIQSLGLGQFSPLVLGGLVGFVVAERAGRPLLAGLALSLLLTKPQTQILVAIAIGMWMLDRRQWRIAVGAGIGTLVLTALIAVPNPAIFLQYVESLITSPPAGVWRPPLPGTILRLVFGWDRFWLTFVPLLPGTVWVVWWYARNRANWTWADRMPLLVVVSYLAAPYGWAYDHIVFLFVVISVVARLSLHEGPGPVIALALCVGFIVYYRVMIVISPDEFHWFWVPVAMMGVCLWANRTRQDDLPPSLNPR